MWDKKHAKRRYNWVATGQPQCRLKAKKGKREAEKGRMQATNARMESEKGSMQATRRQKNSQKEFIYLNPYSFSS